jgi:uncharacterized protein (TIGR02246 family)
MQSEDIAAIKQLEADWRAGWLAGDVDALLSLFADDVALMPAGQPAVLGKEAIRPLYESVFREYFIQSESKVVEIEASGSLGYLWGAYRLTATPKAGGAALHEEGKSLFIVKRSKDGAWKISRLIDNSDRSQEAVR